MNPAVPPSFEVLIVGAGSSGLALGAQLGRVDIRYAIVEREPSLDERALADGETIANIEFDTDLVDAKWKPASRRWQIRVAGSTGIELRTCAVLVDATGPLSRLDITGKDGQKLQAASGDTATAPLRLMVPGFPNLFCMHGPATRAESRARHATSQLEAMVRDRIDVL